MTIASISVKSGGTMTFTGGTDVVYTSLGSGRFANMAAGLSTPEYITIESTVNNDTGKDSSFLVKFEHYTAPPVGSPYNTPDPKVQVHAVIKCDTSVFTEAAIKDVCLRLGHVLGQPGLLTGILRGDR